MEGRKTFQMIFLIYLKLLGKLSTVVLRFGSTEFPVPLDTLAKGPASKSSVAFPRLY